MQSVHRRTTGWPDGGTTPVRCHVFFPQNVELDLDANAAAYSRGAEVLSVVSKRPGREADLSPPS